MSSSLSYPIFFGNPDRPLFGWIHGAEPATASSVGLVICNPFGFDAVCSNRFIRHLAQNAASNGIPAIRFDYDGTGDSAGDDFEPGRVEAWLQSIDAAASLLKQKTGVTSICFIGIRLGALLATHAAVNRNDVMGLALISPVVRGKAYVRELRAFQAASVTTDDPEGVDLESGGYVMTAETVARLSDLSLDNLASKPAANILLLDREDLPVAQKTANSLKNLGANVTYFTTPDHTLLVRSPTPLELPTHVLESCSTWLASIRESHTPTTDGAVAFQTQSGETVTNGHFAAFTETAGFIDTDNRLFAVVSSPTAKSIGAKAASKTGVLFLNSGAVNHIGPSRLYVTLSREWAAAGHVSMRLDIAGIGNSLTPTNAQENTIYPPHARDNVALAVDVLRTRFGVKRVLAIGLCSGAYHAFLAAKTNVNVNDIVLMNPLTFYWHDGMPLDEGELSPKAALAAIEAQRYRASFRSFDTWKKLFTGKADLRSFSKVLAIQLGSKCKELRRELRRMIGPPLENDLATDLHGIDAKRVRTTLIFGSTDLGLPRMMTLGGNALKRHFKKDRARLHIIAGADHTFMQLKHRKILIELLSQSLQKE